jgi:hypothetical protein
MITVPNANEFALGMVKALGLDINRVTAFTLHCDVHSPPRLDVTTWVDLPNEAPVELVRKFKVVER